MPKTIIGVMGPGEGASRQIQQAAYELGKQIALRRWVLLTGGRSAGVMEAASCGAKAAGGLTVGILPGASLADASSCVDIPILTNMGNGRNSINVLSSQVIVACGLGAGTAAEIALALKTHKPLVLLQVEEDAANFFQTLTAEPICRAETVAIAIHHIERLLNAQI